MRVPPPTEELRIGGHVVEVQEGNKHIRSIISIMINELVNRQALIEPAHGVEVRDAIENKHIVIGSNNKAQLYCYIYLVDNAYYSVTEMETKLLSREQMNADFIEWNVFQGDRLVQIMDHIIRTFPIKMGEYIFSFLNHGFLHDCLEYGKGVRRGGKRKSTRKHKSSHKRKKRKQRKNIKRKK